MKVNEAPEKIYVHRTIHLGLLEASEMNITGSDIEYTRTDVFIEKAEAWLIKNQKGFILTDKDITDFKYFMKGEIMVWR